MIQPPKRSLAFLRWFCREDYLDEIEGDLTELFYKNVNESPRKAQWIFMWSVLKYFRPEFIKSFRNYHSINSLPMLRNYFKIAMRNLVKHYGYSFINIAGLASGMAVALLVGLWVFDELSFNTYFKNYDRIAQVTKAGTFEGKYYQGQDYIPYPLITELQTTYRQNFKHVVPVAWAGGFEAVLSSEDKRLTRRGLYVGEDAPEMFSFEMTFGAWPGLNELHGIMISESTSKAFFGDADPLGKAMKVNNDVEVTVTGVFKDFPRNTVFHGLQFFQPWKFLEKDASWITSKGWDDHFLFLYVQVADGKSMEEVAAAIKKAEMIAIKDLDYMKNELQYDYDILLHPMSKWHLYSNYKEGLLQNGPIQFVWFIGAIGVFVLVLACINFMNLGTARSEKRAKEVGIRKTIGSVRKQLIVQFFSESFLIVLFAFAACLLIVFVALPGFNQLSAKAIEMPLEKSWFWMSSIAFILLTGFLAGSYPAFYLSSFNPVSVLKGTFRAGRYASIPRKTLVVLQFSVSVMLIICTAVIYQQLEFVKSRPVGYNREGLLIMRKKSGEFDTRRDALWAELKKTGVVSSVGESGGDLSGTWSHNGGFSWEGKDPSFEANFATLNVSHEFGKTVGWQFIDGRDFSRDIASDSAGIVLNEAAVEYMKLKDPVGKTVRWTNRAWNVDQDFRIVGIVKDMIMNSPFEPVKPAMFFTYGYESVLLIRIAPGVSASEALPKIEKVFTSMMPEIPFDYRFADQQFAAKFANEERIGKLAAVFASLAIFISCLGLFGLASFVAEQRTKEIGIRKVLGASVPNLWRMLSQQFIFLVILSCAIAIPSSYYILNNGLKNYQYHTTLNWWIFAGAGVAALGITLLTVSFQAIKAALMNPVKSLRSE